MSDLHTSFMFTVECVKCCNSTFRSVTPPALPKPANTQSARIIACAGCGFEYHIAATLEPVKGVLPRMNWPKVGAA